MADSDILANRYRLDDVVGAGGMSVVHRAHDLRLDREVAVKVLAPNLAVDPVAGRRFRAEASLVSAITHPNLVRILDVGEDVERPFYVMELIDGETLEARLRRGPELTLSEVASVIGQVAAALEALHQHGLVHRDVKPANVLLGLNGVAKLADFGLVRGEPTGHTAPGMAVGTLAYLAPELLRGADATPASDTYALGVVAYRALTGGMPYPSRTIAELVEAQSWPPPLVSQLQPEADGGVDRAVAAALGPATGRPRPSQLADVLGAELATDPRPARAGSRARAWTPGVLPHPATSEVTTAVDTPAALWPAAAQPAHPAHGPVRRRNIGVATIGLVGVLAFVGAAAALSGGNRTRVVGAARTDAVIAAAPSTTPSQAAAPRPDVALTNITVDPAGAKNTADKVNLQRHGDAERHRPAKHHPESKPKPHYPKHPGGHGADGHGPQAAATALGPA